MDYSNTLPYHNLAIGSFLLGIFTYYGISLINLLVTVIYPIIKIQAYLHNDKILNIINNKEINDTELLLEGFFWLKYWCVYSIWYTIEYYVYYIPLINYIKLSIFGYILVKHDIENNTNLYIYDNIDKIIIKDYEPIIQKYFIIFINYIKNNGKSN
jgi:hypothetical protein